MVRRRPTAFLVDASALEVPLVRASAGFHTYVLMWLARLGGCHSAPARLGVATLGAALSQSWGAQGPEKYHPTGRIELYTHRETFTPVALTAALQ